MPTICFESASPAVGSDVFNADITMKRYTQGKVKRKITFIAVLGGTVGTGKFNLRYGADVIAYNIQSQSADATYLSTEDFQLIQDNRWCDAMSEITLETVEAPAATLTFIVGVWEAKGAVV